MPWNEQVELKAGEHLTVRAKLEPLASTGFTLVSEPAGATAILDGRALDGLTPLRVESMLPGKHHVEVRNATGQWSQEVTVEAGKMLDLRAVLTALPAAVAVAPKPPVVAAPPPVALPPVVAVQPPAPRPVEKEPPAPKPVKIAAAEQACREAGRARAQGRARAAAPAQRAARRQAQAGARAQKSRRLQRQRRRR